ncbi:hypothetical protein NITMOv2_1864 [Nitrospira moscoviensis]|uniref:Uncharacterized protein n=1 Tax=Nitrospira moscoviensis TaxID=42253 RepID=A0A0K2GBN7_NITMO|nr:hypothetical protein NITMOv2_1864 [Nitrospira moscoviensis]
MFFFPDVIVVLRIAGQDLAKFPDETGELVGIAVPHVFEKRGRDVVGGVPDPFIEQRTEVFDDALSGAGPLNAAHAVLQILDVVADQQAAHVADLFALFVLSEGAELQTGPLEDRVIRGKELDSLQVVFRHSHALHALIWASKSLGYTFHTAQGSVRISRSHRSKLRVKS